MQRICLFLSGLLAFAVLSTASPAFSQDKPAPSSHEKTALELYQLIGGTNSAEAGADAMLEVIIKNNPEMKEYRDVFRSWYIKVFADKAFESQVAGLYVKFFTEGELHELIAFYKTPVGQKTLKALPEIAKQSAMIGENLAEAHAQELQEMLMKAIEKKSQENTNEKM
ncbi:MAG: DUF2059 domain-containing protein [Thermodesulfovibrionales bacterium]|jgi:hypothetical protein